MWSVTFVLTIAFGVLSNADDEMCNQRQPTHCFTPDIGPIKFPNSVEALDNLCPVFKPQLKCQVDFISKCGIKDPGSVEEKLPVFYEVIVEACDKESTLHKELSTHLYCVENVLTSLHNACFPMFNEAMDEITREFQIETDEEGFVTKDEDWTKYNCFKEAFEAACFAATTSVRCGKDAKDLVVEVSDRIQILDLFCYESIRDDAKAAVARLIPVMEEKLAMQDIISKI